MTDHERIEHLLRNAPRRAAPAGLRQRLKEEINLPGPGNARQPEKWRVMHPFATVLSLAASAAVLAAVAAAFFWPSPSAYSFQKSLEAIDNASSIRIIHEFRHGPRHRTDFPGGGWSETSYHPSNPFVAEERTVVLSNGRALFHSQSPLREVVRNGPLSLVVDQRSGERTFTLAGRYVKQDLDLKDVFVQLEEATRKGEIRHEVTGRKDGDGNLEIEIRHLRHGNEESDDFQRLYVDPRTFFPVRYEIWDTGYPEYGSAVLMNRMKVVEYDFPVDYERFAIEPTDEDLAKFGLEREELATLPLDTVSIEINGEEGLAFRGYFQDETERFPVGGTVPQVLVEVPSGDFHLYLETETGESGIFTIRLGDFEIGMGSPALAVYRKGRASGGFGMSPTDDPETHIRKMLHGR